MATGQEYPKYQKLMELRSGEIFVQEVSGEVLAELDLDKVASCD
jgi:hypothetical protein